MEVMIAHPLVLPDEAQSLGDPEAAVQAWGLAVQQQALAEARARQAAHRPVSPCPTCGHAGTTAAGAKRRRVETVFGPVWLCRQRRRCPACGGHFQPDDAALRPALGAGRCTPKVRELAALCGASWPYQQAAAVLGTLRGTPLAPETIRAVTGHMGAAVAAQHEAEAAAAIAPPASAPPPVVGPARLDVAVDGAWVRSHETADGMEIKVGVVHTGSARCGRTRTRLRQRRYAATAHGVRRFGPLLTAAIAARDGYDAGEATWLGDGAAWIWRLHPETLATATPVLDRWHLHEERRRALRATVPDKAERAPWSARVEAALDTGDVPTACAVLAELATAYPHERLAAFAAYLRDHAPHIPDYAARRAAGRPNGSGAIEKGVDVVVNRRCKGKRGMRWQRRRADGGVALRVAQLNGEWDQRLATALKR
jgi:Uncharacterised protein family (UPF0236)